MTERAHILIVDDEKAIRYFLSEELEQAGYEVQTAANGEKALACLEETNFDLIILDLMMDGIDGLQVMKEIEKQPLAPQVIILTAHASFDTAVGALRMGGCDYLKKPCRTEEILASVARALAKRDETLQQQEMLQLIEETARRLRPHSTALPATPSSEPRFLEGQGLLVDRKTTVVTRCGQPLALTPSEFQLLLCLMENHDEPVGYSELAAALHGDRSGEWDDAGARKAISTHLWRLRCKLGQAPDGSPYITNIRGMGYTFASGGPASPQKDLTSHK